MLNNNFYVFTGGPGAGKTTVLEKLADSGYHVVPEAGRLVIQQQVAMGGDALPWHNAEKFRQAMHTHAIETYRESENITDKPIFFDRGMPDLCGERLLHGLSIPPELEQDVEQYRYNPKVFIFPAWAEIYINDSERKQTYEQALATHDSMVQAYTAAGYTLVEVPCIAVLERVNFILQEIGASAI